VRILITGGAGYIGSMLTNLLFLDGHEVDVYDNFYYNQGHLVYDALSKYGIKHAYNVDVTDLKETEVKHYDVIIPLACLVGAPLCDKEPGLSTAVNLLAIKNLCRITSKNQCIIFPCTNSGYGKADVDVCTEETPMKSVSLYGRLKEEAEDVIMSRGNATSLRLATVFGWSHRPRLDLLVNTLVYEAYFKRKLALFQGNFRRNYVHVRDVCDAFRYCIEHPSATHNQIFNIGNDECNTTKLGLVEKIKEHLPNTIVEEIEKQDPDQRDYNVSSEKMRKLGWKAKINLDAGIEELINFYSFLPTDWVQRSVIVKPMFNV
jgi:nucleoside-diphosphate-sugar epimerase